jgi:hypothetical protein
MRKCGEFWWRRKYTDYKIIQRMRFACWITKATDTLRMLYITLNAFPQQKIVIWMRISVKLHVLFLSCFPFNLSLCCTPNSKLRAHPTCWPWLYSVPATVHGSGFVWFEASCASSSCSTTPGGSTVVGAETTEIAHYFSWNINFNTLKTNTDRRKETGCSDKNVLLSKFPESASWSFC